MQTITLQQTTTGLKPMNKENTINILTHHLISLKETLINGIYTLSLAQKSYLEKKISKIENQLLKYNLNKDVMNQSIYQEVIIDDATIDNEMNLQAVKDELETSEPVIKRDYLNSLFEEVTA